MQRCRIFEELEDYRAFELLRNQTMRADYLLTKQVRQAGGVRRRRAPGLTKELLDDTGPDRSDDVYACCADASQAGGAGLQV